MNGLTKKFSLRSRDRRGSNLDKEKASTENLLYQSSEKNRNFLGATLIIFIYTVVVVLQTSDLHLLVGRTIKLPAVDVEMPVFAFYFSAPLLVIALHFNLLQNIESHFVKLTTWRQQFPSMRAPRNRLFPFIFDLAYGEEEGVFSNGTRFVNQLLFFWTGPLVLLLLFWRFTDYQSEALSTWQFSCFALDLWLVRRCRDFIDGTMHHHTPHDRMLFRSIRLLLQPFTWIYGSAKSWSSNATGLAIWLVGLSISAIYSAVILFDFQILSKGVGPTLRELLAPRLQIERRANLLALDEKTLRLQHELRARPSNDDKSDLSSWFLSSGYGLDLRGRSLKYAQLPYADLRRVWLQGAKLHGADMVGAQLQRAELENVQMPGAILIEANLEGANLMEARMEGVQLSRANLRQAILWGARLQAASLDRAELQGAIALSADFSAANLVRAQMQGTQFPLAKFDGALLGATSVWGAKFGNNPRVQRVGIVDEVGWSPEQPPPSDWKHWMSVPFRNIMLDNLRQIQLQDIPTFDPPSTTSIASPSELFKSWHVTLCASDKRIRPVLRGAMENNLREGKLGNSDAIALKGAAQTALKLPCPSIN